MTDMAQMIPNWEKGIYVLGNMSKIREIVLTARKIFGKNEVKTFPTPSTDLVWKARAHQVMLFLHGIS